MEINLPIHLLYQAKLAAFRPYFAQASSFEAMKCSELVDLEEWKGLAHEG